MFLANTFFQHKLIHRYAWRTRDKRGEQKIVTDYVAMDERLTQDALDAKMVTVRNVRRL